MRDYSRYVEAWKRRATERQRELARRKEKASRQAMELARILVHEYRVQQVYVFGSLAQDDSLLPETSASSIQRCKAKAKVPEKGEP
ncbi:hypothetical protein [Candidatus Hakubella thermalkaliphila]|nr:hypothetical protein [Candidatus Hakubella thermalkaliphila]